MINVAKHQQATERLLEMKGEEMVSCDWPGTRWEGKGKDARVLPCGAKAVGVGIFCDPQHKYCFAATVCQRHRQPLRDWHNV